VAGLDKERNTGPDSDEDCDFELGSAGSGAVCPAGRATGVGVAIASEVAPDEASRIGVAAGKMTTGVAAGSTITRGAEEAAGDAPAFAISSAIGDIDEDGSALFSSLPPCFT
jgi:hypothetical protein